jgi:hypothetical protein
VYHIDCEEYGVKDSDTWGYRPVIDSSNKEIKNTTALF